MPKHRDTACTGIRVPGVQDGRAGARMAAFGWLSPGPRRPRCVAAFPAGLPGGGQQMTPTVELPLLAHWNSTRG